MASTALSSTRGSITWASNSCESHRDLPGRTDSRKDGWAPYVASCSITSSCLESAICFAWSASTSPITTRTDLTCRSIATRPSRAPSNRRAVARSSRFRASAASTTATRGRRERVASVFRHHSTQAARHRNRSRNVEFTVPNVHGDADRFQRKSPRSRAQRKLEGEPSEALAEGFHLQRFVWFTNAFQDPTVALGHVIAHGAVDAGLSHHAEQRNRVRGQGQRSVEQPASDAHSVANPRYVQRRHYAHHSSDAHATGKCVGASRDAGTAPRRPGYGKRVKPERVGYLHNVSGPVDHAAVRLEVANAEPRPLNDDDTHTRCSRSFRVRDGPQAGTRRPGKPRQGLPSQIPVLRKANGSPVAQPDSHAPTIGQCLKASSHQPGLPS